MIVLPAAPAGFNRYLPEIKQRKKTVGYFPEILIEIYHSCEIIDLSPFSIGSSAYLTDQQRLEELASSIPNTFQGLRNITLVKINYHGIQFPDIFADSTHKSQDFVDGQIHQQ
jgi:hypothetical protein